MSQTPREEAKPLLSQGEINSSEPVEPLKWHQKFLQAIKPSPCPWTLGGYLRLLFVCFILSAAVLGIIFHKDVGNFLSEDGPLAKFVKRIGFWGPIVYASVYAVCTVCFVPGTALTLAAGIIFPQLWIALLTVVAGSNIGAWLAFLLGKTVLRSWVQTKVEDKPVFRAIDAAVGKRGFVMVLLLRLSPVIPFNLLNYSLALTAVHFPAYSIAGVLGMLPGTFMYVYIPWAGVHAATTKGTANLVKDILVYGLGSLVTIVVVVLVTVLARRAVKTAMDDLEKQEIQDRETAEE